MTTFSFKSVTHYHHRIHKISVKIFIRTDICMYVFILYLFINYNGCHHLIKWASLLDAFSAWIHTPPWQQWTTCQQPNQESKNNNFTMYFVLPVKIIFSPSCLKKNEKDPRTNVTVTIVKVVKNELSIIFSKIIINGPIWTLWSLLWSGEILGYHLLWADRVLFLFGQDHEANLDAYMID